MKLDLTTPPPATDWNVLSLGAGVQSSTLALMAAHGEVTPHLDAAVFADTQAEPRAVYRWLDWLEEEIARSPHPFPVHRVSAGSLRLEALTMRMTRDGRAYSKSDVPLFTRDNETGAKGMIGYRSCTYDFKIRPLNSAVRRIAGVKRGERSVVVTRWIGISFDELQRMKDSREPWAQNRYPLVERRLRRADCLAWMRARGFPEPPRSACEFCPFHSDSEWRRLQVEDPEAFARAVQFERDLQALKAESESFRTTPFLHSSLQPLDQVDFSTPEDRGQLSLWQTFEVECEGMCGV